MPTSFHQKLGQIDFSFENFIPKPGQVAYYVKPDRENYKGFFMEQNNNNEWKVIHRQIVPLEILNIERLLSRVILQNQ